MADTEWTAALIRKLRKLWDQGLSTSEICRQLGVSKSAAVGKAHRLDLPGRPSPIAQRGAYPKERKPKRPFVEAVTLPPLPSVAAASPRIVKPPALRAAPPRPPAPPRWAPGGRIIPCCWPLGEPGTRSFRWCDAPSVPSKPYCLEHCRLSYVRVVDRREASA